MTTKITKAFQAFVMRLFMGYCTPSIGKKLAVKYNLTANYIRLNDKGFIAGNTHQIVVANRDVCLQLNYSC